MRGLKYASLLLLLTLAVPALPQTFREIRPFPSACPMAAHGTD
jgi:hypothetical protein